MHVPINYVVHFYEDGEEDEEHLSDISEDASVDLNDRGEPIEYRTVR